MRQVSHFEEYMSPFHEPSFITEHFLIRPEAIQMGFDAYNPQAIDLTDLRLNIFIAKLRTERVGTQTAGSLTATNERWEEVLNKLYKRTIPHKPLTITGVRAPAEAPAGQ